ncbi:MAG: HlyU family transcriptional regulator [Sneathiella sp.]
MISFLSKLFGGGTPKEPALPTREDPVSYNNYAIIPAPEEANGGSWRLSGHIVKESENGPLERTYVRADTFPTRAEAIEFTVRKGKQIVDQQADQLFKNGEPTGRA